MAWPGELWLTDFGERYPSEPSGWRPALVIGPASYFDDRLPIVIVAPLTSTRRAIPLHVEVEASAANGLDGTSYVQCELLRSVNKRRLVTRLGSLDPTTLERVDVIVRNLLAH